MSFVELLQHGLSLKPFLTLDDQPQPVPASQEGPDGSELLRADRVLI